MKVKCSIIACLVSLISWTQLELDPYKFSKFYKNIPVDSLNKVFISRQGVLEFSEQRILNTIAYCDAIDLKGNHREALELIESLKIFENSQSLSKSTYSEYYSVLGNISLRNENPELAVKQFNKAIQLIDEGFTVEHQQVLFMRMSNGLNAVEDYESALEYLNRAMLLESRSDNRNSLYLKLNLALTESKLGNLQKAKKYFKNALVLVSIQEDKYAEVRTYGNLADIYAVQDSFDVSEEYYQKGLSLAVETEMVLDKIRFYKSLSELYNKMSLFEKSIRYSFKADSISKLYNSFAYSEDIATIDLNQQIIIEQEEKERASLKLIGEEKENTFLFWLTLTLFVLALSFAVLFLRLKKIGKQKFSKGPRVKKESNNIQSQHMDLIKKLKNLLENTDFVYAKDLSIDSVAKKLQTNRTYLSEAINRFHNKSFTQLINGIRIEKAREMILDPNFDHYSIEGIAELVGFSSISSFNNNFKKLIGATPSSLRKNRMT